MQAVFLYFLQFWISLVKPLKEEEYAGLKLFVWLFWKKHFRSCKGVRKTLLEPKTSLSDNHHELFHIAPANRGDTSKTIENWTYVDWKFFAYFDTRNNCMKLCNSARRHLYIVWRNGIRMYNIMQKNHMFLSDFDLFSKSSIIKQKIKLCFWVKFPKLWIGHDRKYSIRLK